MSRSPPPAFRGPRQRLGLAVVAALLILAIPFDRALSLWAQGWPEPVLAVLAQVTRYGEYGWVLYPAAFLCAVMAALAVLARWRLMRTLLWQFSALYGFILAGVGLPVLATAFGKRLLGRARPMLMDSAAPGFAPNWADWSHQSFPSGHATTAFALAVVIGCLAPRWIYPAFVLAAIVAVSRVALGAHYPSDVVAGGIVGVVGAYAARRLFLRCGWLFRADGQGGIAMRPLASLTRYIALKRRDSGRAPRRGQP